MNEKTGTGVSTKKEKVKESQSQSVTPSLDTPSGAGLRRHKQSLNSKNCVLEHILIYVICQMAETCIASFQYVLVAMGLDPYILPSWHAE